jgi:phosphatidylethanolamine/phosphatidyl-N-methylethanolamine N-methyltransferase
MREYRQSDSAWGGHLAFLGALIRNPRAVGAIAPSSASLARRMVRDVAPASRVVELGPGTGVITREILARQADAGSFLAVDVDRAFVDRIRRAWPGIDCVCASAEFLPLLAAERGWPQIDHIVSGLPFATLPSATTRLILDGVHQVLRPGGTFTTFQYVHAYRVPSASAFRREMSRRLGGQPAAQLVVRNMPPAFVLTWHRGAR